MTALIHQLVAFSAANPSVIGLIALLSAAAEAIIVVGALFPGTGIVLALAGLAGAAHGDVLALALWATAGAVIGDGLSFWVGHRHGDRLRRAWPFARRHYLLERGAEFFARHGAKSVFIARFLPGLRAIVPVVGGMLGMSAARFYTANVASAVVWSAVHVFPAAGLGVAFSTLGNASGRLAALVLAGLLSALAAVWLARVMVLRLGSVAAAAYEHAIDGLGRRPGRLPRRIARLLDPSRPRLSAIAAWSVVLTAAALGLAGILENLVPGNPLVRADTAINHFVQSLRTPAGDAAMAVVTSLGDGVVLGGVAAAVFAWLLWRRAHLTAAAVALTLGAAAVFVPLMKAVLHKPRPIALYSGADAFSFPSGHTTLATVLFGIVAVLVAKSLPRAARVAVFAVAGSLAAAVGLSRIYLSAHWPSDVIAGFLFGTAITAAFALTFEHLPPRRIGGRGLAGVAVASFVALGSWHAAASLPANLVRFAPRPTVTTMMLDDWMAGRWRDLPADRIDLIGEAEEPLALQWAGDAGALEKALAAAGWRRTPGWAVEDAVRFLDPAAALPALPPLPILHDGRLAVLTMTRALAAAAGPVGDRRLVFRLWPSEAAVIRGPARWPLLLGSIAVEAVRHPWGLFTALHERAGPANALAALAATLSAAPGIRLPAPAGAGPDGTKPILALPAAGG